MGDRRWEDGGRSPRSGANRLAGRAGLARMLATHYSLLATHSSLLPIAMPRIPTTGDSNPLANTPFAGLSAAGLPSAKERGASSEERGGAPPPAPTSKRKEPNRNRGRVDVGRQTAGRGGKTVTVIAGFKGIAEKELQELARAIQRSAGVGGTLKPGSVIEIQGDQRQKACAVLEEAGFRPVLAGG